jgi:DNA polymerase-3 subunit delta'
VSFRELAGQEQAVDFFRRAIRTRRLAHAYILVGPEGVGKRRFARALAQYLFCEKPHDDSCGTCRPCRLIQAGQFPDLHWYQREEERQQLTVDVIKQFLREISFKPLEADRKVFVVEDADKLNPWSANRLLKILEEPPEASLLLLLALDVRDFLPTILSRCHVIRLRSLSGEALARWLEKEHACPPERARYLAHFTMGSPGLAAELAHGEFFEEREWLMNMTIALMPGEHFAPAEEMFRRAGGSDEGAQDRRETLLRFFDVLDLFYRDVLAAALGDGEATLVNTDRRKDIEVLAKRLTLEQVGRILGSIEAARRAMSFNANQKLLLENLAFDIAKVNSV